MATTFTGEILTALPPWPDTNGQWTGYNTTLGGMFEQCYGFLMDQGDPDVPSTYVPSWSVLLDPDNCPTDFLPYLAQFVGVVLPPGIDDLTSRLVIKAEAGMNRGTVASIQAAALRFLSGSSTIVGTLQVDGTLSGDIPLSDVIVTSLPTNPLTNTLAPQVITLIDPTGSEQQQFQVMVPVQAGSTTVPIYPAVPQYNFPVNSTIYGPWLFIRERFNGVQSVADPYHLTLGVHTDEVTDINQLTAAVNAVKPAGLIVDVVDSTGQTWNETTNTWEEETATWDTT